MNEISSSIFSRLFMMSRNCSSSLNEERWFWKSTTFQSALAQSIIQVWSTFESKTAEWKTAKKTFKRNMFSHVFSCLKRPCVSQRVVASSAVSLKLLSTDTTAIKCSLKYFTHCPLVSQGVKAAWGTLLSRRHPRFGELLKKLQMFETD